MKHTPYIFSLILGGLFCGINANASDSIMSRSVTVEREYHPVIREADKIRSTPTVLELKTGKIAPEYTNFNQPLEAGFNIHTLAAAEPAANKNTNNTPGFARLGLGNRWNSLLDFAYPLLTTPDTRLDFSLNHLGTYGQKGYVTTKSALAFDKYFDNFIFNAGLGFKHEYLKYYGNNFNNDNQLIGSGRMNYAHNPASMYKENEFTSITRAAQTYSLQSIAMLPLSNNLVQTNAYAGIKSRQNDEDLQYYLQMQHKSFHASSGQTENILHTSAGVSSPRNDNRIGVDVELYNLWYKSDSTKSLNFYKSYYVMYLNPYYLIQGSNYHLRLGFNAGLSFVHGRNFNPSLDLNGEWQAVPELFSLYGAVTGKYNLNTLENIYSQNRYISYDIRVTDNYTPIDITAGFRTKPTYNLLIDASVQYKTMEDQYFFVNKAYHNPTVSGADSIIYSNRFNVLYANASRFRSTARISYTLRDLADVSIAGAYNHWEVKNQVHAWNMPSWETSLNAQVHINHDLSISTDVFADGGRFAKLGNNAIEMKPRMDINLGMSYVYNDWITTFVKLNNLFNSHYQDYYGYDNQGINILLGASLSF